MARIVHPPYVLDVQIPVEHALVGNTRGRALPLPVSDRQHDMVESDHHPVCGSARGSVSMDGPDERVHNAARGDSRGGEVGDFVWT